MKPVQLSVLKAFTTTNKQSRKVTQKDATIKTVAQSPFAYYTWNSHVKLSIQTVKHIDKKYKLSSQFNPGFESLSTTSPNFQLFFVFKIAQKKVSATPGLHHLTWPLQIEQCYPNL